MRVCSAAEGEDDEATVGAPWAGLSGVPLLGILAAISSVVHPFTLESSSTRRYRSRVEDERFSLPNAISPKTIMTRTT